MFYYLRTSPAQEPPVDWAYEVRDDLVAMLRDGDNHHRSIAAQRVRNSEGW
jgi:hypothetical protein